MPRYAERIAYAARLAYGRWQPPALTPAEVWQGFPAWLTDPDDPVRDAIGAGLAEVFTRVASDSSRMASMHLRKHAREWALDLVAAAAGTTRGPGERDGALRERLAVIEDAVSPDAIRAAASVAYPGAVMIEPWRHGLYLGRGYLGRPPIDHRATREADDGQLRLFDVGRVRLWTRTAARLHFVLPQRGGFAFYGPAPTDSRTGRINPTGRLFLTRSVSSARSYLSSNARASQTRTLAATIERVRAAGVRWTATFDFL